MGMELILGAILGVFATEIFNFLKRKYKVIILRNTINKSFLEQDGFLALDHAIPYYKKENITLRDTGKLLFIGIPQKYREELSKYKFEIREPVYFDETQSLATIFDKVNVENINELTATSTDEAAMEFLSDLRQGYMRFNGLMYGVKKIRPERLTTDENSGIDIDFYKTDYFTYRVFGKIYQKLKAKDIAFKIEKLQDLNLYSPFLSSCGLGTFLIINRGHGDEVIIGRRSNAVVVDKGKWHFSMNEAFSMKDKDEYGYPSFSACLFRGLEEELGISEIFKKYVKQYEFLDLYMLMERFELGITSFVRIELNETFTFEILMDLYSIAQDGELETSSIISLPIKDIDSFIQKNYNEISAGCRAAMRALNARYKAGYLRDEL